MGTKKIRVNSKRISSIHLEDLDSIIDEIVSRNIDPTVFDDIDEGDIPKAKNCVDFFLSRKFLNLPPFPKQLQICLEFFEEFCPHCSDPKIIHSMFDQEINEILDRVQLLEYGKCKKCGRTKYDLYKEGHVKYKHSLRGCAGQRGGKSKIVSWFCIPYVLHRYLTLGQNGYRISPQRYFGLPPTDILKGTCTALTVSKAMDLIWNPLIQTINNSPWFKQYHEFLSAVGEKKGTEILHNGATFMFYQHKRIAMGPETPDFGKLRGATRWFSAIDEIDYFDSAEDSKKVTLSAEEISTSLENSLETVRNKASKLKKKRPFTINAYSFDISSPSSITGKIMRELEKSKVDPHIYGFHYSTWEMNPNYTYEDLKEKFDTNPVRAWRDWGAVPPLAENPFFENVSALKKSIREDKQDLITYKITTRKDKFGETTVYAEVKPNYKDDIPRLLTVDMGASNNAFSLILSHLEEDKPYLDFVLIVEPLELTRDKKIKINTRAMFEYAIVPILENYKVTHVVYDRWSSIDAIREIRDKYEIEAEQYTLTPSNFEETIWPALNTPEEISYPKPDVNLEELDTSKYNKDFGGFETVMKKVKSCFISTLFLQMLTVRQAGRKVVKPLNGDDDGFRAFCLALVYLLNEDINYKFKGSGSQTKIKRGTRMGVVMSLGGGGGMRSGSGGGGRVGRLASRSGGASGGVKAGGVKAGGSMGRVARS